MNIWEKIFGGSKPPSPPAPHTPEAKPAAVAQTTKPAAPPSTEANYVTARPAALKASSSAESESLTLAKKLLRESSGARDFLRRASIAGFNVVGEDWMGLTMEGRNCKFIFSCLASQGPDKIWSFVFKDGDKPSKTLISEGKIIE